MNSGLHIYNSLEGKKELFEALNPPFVGMYVCGPTVYNEVHLGNLRSFTSFDVVFRYLKHLGYKVRYVRNITDVGHLLNDADEGEDKIAKQARLEQLEPMEIVQRYTNSFHDVTKLFNLLNPDIEPTATGHILEQIEMVQQILDNGFAYEVNGSVYFDVEKYNEKHKNYGALSGRVLEDLQANSRALDGQSEKKNPHDFAIWKSASDEHIMRWNSPWGSGHPGWHLECSVMSTKYLGEQFDIHGGGMDLKFPHHECEIAQNVGAKGVSPVRYWMHGNMLTVNGTKMSKSLGNAFLPLELVAGAHEMLEKGYEPMVIRFFMLQSHYRSTLDFSNDALNASEKGYYRLTNAYEAIGDIKTDKIGQSVDQTLVDEIKQLCAQCTVHMNDDFNTAETIARLFDMSKIINALKEGKRSIEHIDQATFDLMVDTFSTFFFDVLGLQVSKGNDDSALDGVMQLVLELRQAARANKDWATSDKIRDGLAELNLVVKDGKDGSSWSYN